MQRHQPRSLKQGSDTDWQIAKNEPRLSAQHKAQCHCSRTTAELLLSRGGSQGAGASPWHWSVCHQRALPAWLLLFFLFFFFLEKTFCLKLLNTLNISLSYTSKKGVKNKCLLTDVVCRWIHAWVRTTDWPRYNFIYWTGWKKKKGQRVCLKSPEILRSNTSCADKQSGILSKIP